MKITIGKNEIQQVIKYFGSIDTLINLYLSAKKWNGLFDEITENTVSLNQQTIQFFPNIRKLHLYRKEDAKLVTNSNLILLTSCNFFIISSLFNTFSLLSVFN